MWVKRIFLNYSPWELWVYFTFPGLWVTSRLYLADEHQFLSVCVLEIAQPSGQQDPESAPGSIKAKPHMCTYIWKHIHTLNTWLDTQTNTDRKQGLYGIHVNKMNTQTNMNSMNGPALVLLSGWSGSKSANEIYTLGASTEAGLRQSIYRVAITKTWVFLTCSNLWPSSFWDLWFHSSCC